MRSFDFCRLLSISACLLVGCLSAPRSQLYDGPALPRHAVAQIREDVATLTRVESIDGVEVGGSRWDVLPGEHVLVASTRMATDISNGDGHDRVFVRVNCEIRFTARAGRTYLAKRDGEFERTGLSHYEYQLAAYVVDAEAPDEPLGSFECEDDDFGIMADQRISVPSMTESPMLPRAALEASDARRFQRGAFAIASVHEAEIE